jgi:hypothetical protein
MTAELKEHYAVVAVLGVGVIALLVHLLRQSSPAVAAASVPGAVASSPSYPNAQPIKLGNIDIGGSPSYISYNQGEPGAGYGIDGAGGCGCSNPDQLVVTPNIPSSVLQSGVDQLASFQAKAPKSGAQRAAYTFSD